MSEPATAGPCSAGPGNGDARIKEIGGPYKGQGVYSCFSDGQRFNENVLPSDLPLNFQYKARVKNDANNVKNITDKLESGKTFRVKPGRSTPPITVKVHIGESPFDEGIDVFIEGLMQGRPLDSADEVNVDIDTDV